MKKLWTWCGGCALLQGKVDALEEENRRLVEKNTAVDERVRELEKLIDTLRGLLAEVSAGAPRRLVVSHAQGDSDVVEIGGGEPARFIKSFDNDEAAHDFIDSGGGR